MDLFRDDVPRAGRRLFTAAAAVFFMVIAGSIGFHLLEGWTLVESIYVATQTVTTVGYGDLTPNSAGGRIFSTIFMLAGAGTVLYALTLLAQAAIQTEVGRLLDTRRRVREMERLDSHFIVCGAGRVGRRIIRNLQRQGEPFVLIESDPERVETYGSWATHVIEGDATSEDTLLAAGVERARGLATCLPDDADNVYVVLTARGLNPDLHIVARAVEEQAEPKLIRAGASRVVSPTIIGSQSMARALLKPAIADFMDSIVAESLDLVFEEIAIHRDSPLAGKTLGELSVFDELSVIVVAVRKTSGDMEFQPRGETRIAKGDLLIVVGKADSVKHLVELNK